MANRLSVVASPEPRPGTAENLALASEARLRNLLATLVPASTIASRLHIGLSLLLVRVPTRFGGVDVHCFVFRALWPGTSGLPPSSITLSSSLARIIVLRPILVLRIRPCDSHAFSVHGLIPPSRLAASLTDNNSSIVCASTLRHAHYRLRSTKHRRTIWHMPNNESRTYQKSPRKYLGQYEGQKIADWLNNAGAKRMVRWLKQVKNKGEPVSSYRHTNTKASRDRILWLLNSLRELQRMMKTQMGKKFPSRFPWLDKSEDEISDCYRGINRRLRAYRSSPIVWPVFGHLTAEEFHDRSRRPHGEVIAAKGLIHLVALGLLDRLFRCQCGKWAYAKFLHQRSHSTKCRRKLYENTEEFREKRRKYRRELYRLKKSGNVK